jgi:hypothetical protein
MTYVITKDEKQIERLAAAAWFSVLGGDDGGEGRAWCPGASPPDNSCSPSNKGDGKAAGAGPTKGRKGGRSKPDRVPTRKPSKAEVRLAAGEGTSERHQSARKAVASHFLHSQGSYFDRNPDSPTYEKLVPLDESRYEGQMAAIDWSKPVKIGPPPSMPPPEEFVQWQAPGNIPPSGGYFSTPGTPPEQLGIGRKATAWKDPKRPVVEKVPYAFRVDGAPQYIQSTAAKAVDTWSAQGTRQVAAGGGRQWFVPTAQARGGVREIKLKRSPRRSVGRAFCPGVSPPDNSCSPSNKGDGSPREQSLAKKHDLTPKQAKWALRMIDKLEKKFAGPGRAAAVNEVLSAAKYPKYLKGILESTPTKSEIEAVMAWGVRRGRAWEPAARAFCPGVSPPDNSCSPANKGDGRVSPAKAGNGPLVSAARQRHKKELDRLRKKIAEGPDRAEKKYQRLYDKENALRDKSDAAARERYDLHTEAARLQGIAGQTGKAEDLTAAMIAAEKYLDKQAELDALVKETERAFRNRVAASKARDEDSSFRKTMAAEASAVDKEDGIPLGDRRAASRALEDRHKVEKLVDEHYEKNVRPDSEQGISAAPDGPQSPELARVPMTADARERALNHLRDTVNNTIHEKGLSAPIEYAEGVRASAAGTVLVSDYSEYTNPKGIDREMLETLKMTGVQTAEIVGRVKLDSRDSSHTIIHEYGHQIEHGNYEVAKLCDDFLRSRVSGETPVSLRQTFGEQYDSTEMGSPDDFAKTFQYVYGLDAGAPSSHTLAHYAGKRYSTQFSPPRTNDAGVKTYSLGATEVLSMGMQLMHNSPSRFAQADPEWFDLVAGITTGRILSETREKRRQRK